MHEYIDPASQRGRVALLIQAVIAAARVEPELMRAFAVREGLTDDQALAATIAEAVMDALFPDEGG